jgi:hypothetical protein
MRLKTKAGVVVVTITVILARAIGVVVYVFAPPSRPPISSALLRYLGRLQYQRQFPATVTGIGFFSLSKCSQSAVDSSSEIRS